MKGTGLQRVRVHVEPDHIASLASGSPIAAVSELIWNALDAEATLVTVALELNEFDGVAGVIVRDNGHGITHAEAIEEFGKLGGSWKRSASHSRNAKRILHGQHGSGRFKAFVLGGQVVWSTVSEVDGVHQKVLITGRHDLAGVFDISEPETTTQPTGTQVNIVANQTLQSLQGDSPIDSLTATLALYLEKYPQVIVKYGGTTIDPVSLHLANQSYEVEAAGNRASLRIIEWTKDLGRTLVLTDVDGVALGETPARIQAPGFNFTAYLQGAVFAESHAGSLQAPELDPVLGPLLDRAREQLSDHFRTRSEEADETSCRSGSTTTYIHSAKMLGHPFKEPNERSLTESL